MFPLDVTFLSSVSKNSIDLNEDITLRGHPLKISKATPFPINDPK